MAIFDKIRGVGEAVRDKVKQTFGEPSSSDGDPHEDESAPAAAAPALTPEAAYALLGLAEGVTLADVRTAYRALARDRHPIAVREGADSEAQRALDRLLEALELLEEQLVPLAGATPVTRAASESSLRRKRATARTR